MSLNRFINFDSVLSTNEPQYGQVFEDRDLANVNSTLLSPTISSLESTTGKLVPEVHVYSFNGDLIGSAYDNKFIIDAENKGVFIDLREVFRAGGIERGSYKIAVNLIAPVYGRPLPGSLDNREWPTFIKEISPNRDEVMLTVTSAAQHLALQEFREYCQSLGELDILNNLVINFGFNEVYKIINIRFDRYDQNIFYIKLYQPLDTSIEELDKAWFGIDLMDSYIDTVILTNEIVKNPTNQLRGPKFHMDTDQWDSQATVYKSWDELLSSDQSTSQRIIDGIISGSGQATLNIDYTDFANYIFYGRAQERLEIFKTKMEMIELYESQKTLISSSTASASTIGLTDLINSEAKINVIKNAFDPFERWLYFHDTGSLFTHDVSGSVTPWPKYELNGKVLQHDVTSSIAKTWYIENYDTAVKFDQHNVNSLWYSIPEHILMDDNNSYYVTFMNMIGQHFDVLYSYVNALTQIHVKDEHPERGPSKDLLFHIAKSFGWNLQNTRQLSDLWSYKLGTDETGSMITSSGMKVLPHEEQSKQVWRRIVNNLPYLLKTKGTSRSVKALMSIYGIPQTLISIKEYGGPGIDEARPIYIEDKFAYKLQLESGSYIDITGDDVMAHSYGFDNGSICQVPEGENPEFIRYPDTYEFRFSTRQKGSEDPIYLFSGNDGGQLSFAVTIHSSVYLGDDEIVSGSADYGKISLSTYDNLNSILEESFTKYLPIFDGDLWTIRIESNEFNYTNDVDDDKKYKLSIGRVSDALYGRIAHYDTIESEADFYDSSKLYLGNAPGNIKNLFDTVPIALDGYVQGYKEYFTTYTEDTFKEHIMNPGSYHTDSVSGSFYSLYRYHPLGLDLNREDHTVFITGSSCQPDRSFIPTPITYVGFQGDQDTQYETINETYYSQVPKIGGITLQSEKIRLEDNELLYELNTDMRSSKSEYDSVSTDSNRLAIVFSLTDQINRDIQNHMGFEELDSWIGDPEIEFENQYTTLRNKSNEYFQKYTQRNDINTFIRILSIYDYTFFEQIKQLVPGRADLISGILIEPTILQRSKVQLSKKPVVTNPQWQDVIDLNIYKQSGDYIYLEDTIEIESDVTVGYNYLTGSIEIESDVEIKNNYFTGSTDLKFDVEVQQLNSEDFTTYVKVIEPYSGSIGDLQLIVTGSFVTCKYKKKISEYDPYTNSVSLIKNGLFNDGVDDWIGGEETYLTTGSADVRDLNFERYKHGYILDESLNNVLMQIPEGIVEGNDYVVRIFVQPIGNYQLNSGKDPLKIEISGNDVDYRITNLLSGAPQITEINVKFTADSGNNSIFLYASNPGSTTDYIVYSVEVFPYFTEYEKQFKRAINRDKKLIDHYSLTEWSYQHEEHLDRNAHRFTGSKLVGAGINIDSPNTVDGGPVVEIKESNPNNIFTGDSNSEGNLRLD